MIGCSGESPAVRFRVTVITVWENEDWMRKKYKQRDFVFLKEDALGWWKIKKSKKSIEIQKSYGALKMKENRLSLIQILMQLQAISEQSL